MSNKLTPKQKEFWKRIDEILFYKWDPIGISDYDSTRDEYQSYLPKVFDLALKDDSSQNIADYLTSVTQYMGLSESKGHDLAIANLILEIKESLDIVS